jgi:hypothetical protein
MSRMRVVDLVREHRVAYAATPQPAVVDVGGGSFLAATGRGDPNGAEFQQAVAGLYGVAYTIKFGRRGTRRPAFKVAPLEGLWWGRSPLGDFTGEPRESWNWKILIRVPEDVGRTELEQAKKALAAKGRGEAAGRVRLERLREGRSVQALHVGPYATERRTIDGLLACAREQGLAPSGRHHEVYLSDPRRVAPARLRTILRMAVKAVKRAAGKPGCATAAS